MKKKDFALGIPCGVMLHTSHKNLDECKTVLACG